jgi:hypothetical protein
MPEIWLLLYKFKPSGVSCPIVLTFAAEQRNDQRAGEGGDDAFQLVAG